MSEAMRNKIKTYKTAFEGAHVLTSPIGTMPVKEMKKELIRKYGIKDSNKIKIDWKNLVYEGSIIYRQLNYTFKIKKPLKS